MISIVVISRDEPALESTLSALAHIRSSRSDVEVLVVDSSDGRLDYLKDGVVANWISFSKPKGLRRTIPHQRNAGVLAARGDIIVFTDAGCEPQDGWLEHLTEPLLAGRELMVTGIALSRSGESSYDVRQRNLPEGHVDECATINLAFHRSVFDCVGGFDEAFDYGSDVDFSWRVRDAGIRILRATDAVVTHDWGTRGRQAKRSFSYGRARARLYMKHRSRWRGLATNDPIALIYPLFILGLPLTLRFKTYLALLLIPMLKNRAQHPVRVVADHILYGAGILVEVARR